MKVKSYIIVSHQTKLGRANPKALAELVNDMISRGYTPLGGLAIQGSIVMQAMVKYE